MTTQAQKISPRQQPPAKRQKPVSTRKSRQSIHWTTARAWYTPTRYGDTIPHRSAQCHRENPWAKVGPIARPRKNVSHHTHARHQLSGTDRKKKGQSGNALTCSPLAHCVGTGIHPIEQKKDCFVDRNITAPSSAQAEQAVPRIESRESMPRPPRKPPATSSTALKTPQTASIRPLLAGCGVSVLS